MSRLTPLLLPAAWVGLALFSGCNSSDRSPTPPPPPPIYSSITISTTADTLVVTESALFVASVVDTGGNDVTNPQITWASSDPSIATVTGNGSVTAVGEGQAIITASGGGVTSNPIVQITVQGFGWVAQSTPIIENLRGVHFLDSENGWAVGEVGRIIATDDAGLSWDIQQSNSTGFTLNSVFFTSLNNGFVCGSAGRFLRSINGGLTWQAQTIDNGFRSLNDIFFVDNSRGFIVGNGGLILRTFDAGNQWERLEPAVTVQDLHSVWAIDAGGETYAWAVGAQGTIVGTEDGGDSWKIATPTVTTDRLTGVVRLTVDDALAVGQNNRIAETLPGFPSPSWQLAGVPAVFANFTDIAWPDPGMAYAVGVNQSSIATVQVSYDQGASWTSQPLPGGAPITNAITAVWFVDSARGWAVGRGGLVLHTATGGF